MTANSLVGTWRLVSYEVRSADGRVRQPYGPHPTGYLIYSADGYLAVAFGRADRPPLSSDDFASGSDEEWAGLAKSFTAYSGRYEPQGDRVLHHVEVSLFPNWVGGTQERFLTRDGTRDGNRITLSTPPFTVRGEQRTGRLVWERV